MLRAPRPRWLVLGALAIVVCVSAMRVAPASATTGPTQFLPPSHYTIASKIQKTYVGQYTLKSAAPAARLKGGAMGIEINDRRQLFGVAQFYGYDASGNQSTWVGTLYNFHLTNKHVMIVDVLGPVGSTLLARLFLNRSKNGDLGGQIELPAGRFNIAWKKLPK
jgi:hypothetical protein